MAIRALLDWSRRSRGESICCTSPYIQWRISRFSSSREKYVGLLPILYSHLADIESEARGSLVVDLGLVTFLDTSGLSFLIAAHKQLQALRAQLIVFSPSHRVRRLFDLTRLASYLTIVPD